MLQAQVQIAEDNQASLGKQNNKLLVSKNPQAKTQYLDQLRADANISKKEIIKQQEEIKSLKRKEDQVSKRYVHLQGKVSQFCNNICKVVEMPPVSISAFQEEGSAGSNMEQYLICVLKQVQQGAAHLGKQNNSFTNVHNQSTDAISNHCHNDLKDVSSSFYLGDDDN